MKSDIVRIAKSQSSHGGAIAALPPGREQEVLRRRYILGQRWERIAADNNLTLRRVLQLHHSTIDRLQIS